jgi:hypothetical protein
MAPTEDKNIQQQKSSRKWFNSTSLQVVATWATGTPERGVARQQQQTSDRADPTVRLQNDENFAFVDGPDGALPARVRTESPKVEPLPELRKDRNQGLTPVCQYTRRDVMKYLKDDYENEAALHAGNEREANHKRKQIHSSNSGDKFKQKKSRVSAPTPAEYRSMEIQRCVAQMQEGMKNGEWEMVYKADKEKLDADDDDDVSIVSVDDCPNGEELLDWRNQPSESTSNSRVARISTLITTGLRNLNLYTNPRLENPS